jgi:hypothetical protein
MTDPTLSRRLGERQLAVWTWRALLEVAGRRGDMAEAEHRRWYPRWRGGRRPGWPMSVSAGRDG